MTQKTLEKIGVVWVLHTRRYGTYGARRVWEPFFPFLREFVRVHRYQFFIWCRKRFHTHRMYRTLRRLRHFPSPPPPI